MTARPASSTPVYFTALTSQCIVRMGLQSLSRYCTRTIVKNIFIQLPTLVTRRNMSSQMKRPVTLLGTMAFGGRADAEKSLEMVKCFISHGHKEIDTAYMYTDGQAETILGGMNLAKTGGYLVWIACLLCQFNTRLVYFCIVIFIINNSTVEDNSLISMAARRHCHFCYQTHTRQGVQIQRRMKFVLYFYPGSSTEVLHGGLQ